MAHPRAVLFDLDHTLLDFERAQRAALREALTRFGLPCPRRVLAEYRRINDAVWEDYRRGRTTQAALKRERFRRLLLWMGAGTRPVPRLSEHFLDRLALRGDRMPGCRALLRRLRPRFKLGVVTNGIDRVQRSRLELSGLRPFFDTVVTSEACGFAKPDPRILGVALEALGVRPRQAVYVGDDPAVDGAAAAAAGVPFVWLDGGAAVPEGAPAPRRRVRRLAEVARLLA